MTSARIDPALVEKRFLESFRNWADAEDKARRAEREAKRKFSALVIHYSRGNSVSKAVHLANTDVGYQQALEAAETEAHKANLARAERNATEAWFEALRSAESTIRAELKL